MARPVHLVMISGRCCSILAVGAILCVARGGAQAPQESPQPPAPGEQAQKLAPPSRLGLRAEIIRSAMTASDTVVIVPDGESYLRAISQWRPASRFPILIDDGTVQTRENIARFVRGYQPKHVVAWPDSLLGHEASPKPVKLTGTNPQKQGAIERALLSSWGFADGRTIEDLYEFWRDKEQFAPGIVVAYPADSAWPGAIALAAFRAQPIVWALSPRNVNGMLSREQIEELVGEIESGCKELNFPWRELGDQIDAVSLCLNAPAKYTHAKGEVRATTDRIGRHAIDKLGEARWAWSSQIFGDEAQSAYMAMCALFLTPKTALLFDGYESKPPYSNYEIESARPMLESGGFTVRSYAPPANGREQWLIGAGRTLDAGLILVNSHGMRDAFNLSPGRLRPGSVPILKIPAMVHLIHSWSAVRPGDRLTVAGRWFERGVYVYYGSVNEPFLQAFVPPSMVVGRLRGAFPWAAGVRIKDSPVWKLACFGDPLVTLGGPLQRVDSPTDLDGAVDLAEIVATSASKEQFSEALAVLSVLGRDEDALRLVRALQRERPEAITPDVAALAMFAVGRAGTPSEVFSIYARLDDARSRDPYRLDHLWNLVRLRLRAPGEDDRAMIAYLRSHLREDQRAEDAADLSRGIAQLQTTGAASAFLDSITPRGDRDQQVLDAAKRALSGG